MIVVADTTPLNYLVLIQHEDLLPRLFGRVLIPPAVSAELRRQETPHPVRLWLAQSPSWLQVQPLRSQPDQGLDYLDPGEREAIALAEELKADQILLDEADARQEAARRKLPFIGTLGVLRRAAQLDLIELPSALARLQQTTFYVDPELIGRCWTKTLSGEIADDRTHGEQDAALILPAAGPLL
jgi:predicted nucleic acid-binding protein